MSNLNPKAVQATNGWVPTLSDTLDVIADPANTQKYECCMVYSGAGGNIRVTMVDGAVLTFSSVAAGIILPIQVKRIWTTGTTATSLLALIGRYGM